MNIPNRTIDELKKMLQDKDCKPHSHKANELNNEVENRKSEYGIALSVLILAFLSITIYFCINSNMAIHIILSHANASIIFGLFALLCFYIPHKSIVLRIGRVLLSMSFALYYWIGGGDEIFLIVATICICIGMMMLIFNLFHYFTGIPSFL